MAFQCDGFQETGFQNDCGAAAVTPTGGWFREPKPRFRGETETDREARILPPDEIQVVESQDGPVVVAAPRPIHAPLSTLASEIEAQDAALRLAGLYTSAYIDAQIRKHFRDQDNDDEAVLLLAVAATLH